MRVFLKPNLFQELFRSPIFPIEVVVSPGWTVSLEAGVIVMADWWETVGNYIVLPSVHLDIWKIPAKPRKML